MIPYDAPFVAKMLRRMPESELRRATPTDFQRWPARVAIKGPAIKEMIANELSRRRAAA